MGLVEETGKEMTHCRESIELPNPGLHAAPILSWGRGAYSPWGTSPIQDTAGLEEGTTDRIIRQDPHSRSFKDIIPPSLGVGHEREERLGEASMPNALWLAVLFIKTT